MMVESAPILLPRQPGFAPPAPARPNAGPTIRADFAAALEARLRGWAAHAVESSPPTAREAIRPFLEEGAMRVRHLPEEVRSRLARLQDAAEGIEALVVERLLAEAGKHRFVEEGGAMGDLARDTMRQAIAERAARGLGGLGLARLVFLDAAEAEVKRAVSRAAEPPASGSASDEPMNSIPTNGRTSPETLL